MSVVYAFSHFDLCGHMTLIASCTGYIEFFVTAQAEGTSQCEQTIWLLCSKDGINKSQLSHYNCCQMDLNWVYDFLRSMITGFYDPPTNWVEHTILY